MTPAACRHTCVATTKRKGMHDGASWGANWCTLVGALYPKYRDHLQSSCVHWIPAVYTPRTPALRVITLKIVCPCVPGGVQSYELLPFCVPRIRIQQTSYRRRCDAALLFAEGLRAHRTYNVPHNRHVEMIFFPVRRWRGCANHTMKQLWEGVAH